MLDWQQRCPASAPGWLFANPATANPYHASEICKNHIRPAGEKLGLERIGWHTFRHTYCTLLDETGAPMKVQQELMRHANIQTTMNVYGSAMLESKRTANSKVVRLVLAPSPQPGSEKGRMPAAPNVPFCSPVNGAISRNLFNLMVAGAGFEPATFGL
ncbi:tyrosine-type recombinase/integrase [Alloacidobacterium dinghuense]|uniref:Tyrosine-type recombinase/integrase n=1 Tax=Alloacidobacterium dinghuense TaxID=2763107 RepID=A0A7G8BE90_9BACT|nr:tyrosine-type recombinase/integrase [Alloacidobacterium dinghuense]